MAQQNGGQFDPVLFGDYRDPQDSILNSNFDFFNDALQSPQDFNSPYNTGEATETPQSQKRDLMKEIEIVQNGEMDTSKKRDSSDQLVTCDTIW